MGRGWVLYPLALGAGALFAVWLLSWHAIVPPNVGHAAFEGDEAVSVIGMRYLIGSPWTWPPLTAPALGAGGTNVALTDSIPVAALLAKLVRAWLPPGASAATAWLAFALAVQPAAAVFALRATGARGLLPAACVAALSLSMPALLGRFGHNALSSHAAILLAIGLYLRIVDERSAWGWAAALLAVSLLIHPYIFACVAAVLAAAPLSVLLRGERRGLRDAAILLAACAGCYGLARALGYGGTRETAGFGYFSMNLLAPLLPSGSSLFPELGYDMTGGQRFEGLQYLGAGILLLTAVMLVQAIRGQAASLRRHGGLAVVLALLTLLAGSNQAYAGPLALYHLEPVPAVLAQFHATGRFFWPVAYTCLVAGVATAARLPPRTAALVMLGTVTLQVLDTAGLRSQRQAMSRAGTRWEIDVAALRPVFAAHTALTLWPTFGCGAASASPGDIQPLLLASETLMRTNTAATARDPADADCDPAHTLALPFQPGELRAVLRGQSAWLVPDAAAACHTAGPIVLCSQDRPALRGLPAIAAPLVPPGRLIGPGDALFAQVTGPGWSGLEPAGAWSDGPSAILLLQRPPQPLTLHLALTALAAEPGHVQVLDVTVDGAACGTWRLPDLLPQTVHCTVPPDGPPAVQVLLHIGHPARPIDRGMSQDRRQLGVFLRAVQIGGAMDGG